MTQILLIILNIIISILSVVYYGLSLPFKFIKKLVIKIVNKISSDNY